MKKSAKKDTPKKSQKQSSESETLSPEESLKRMKSFTERKEKFIAAIKKSQN
jgi:cytochrome c556